MSGINDGKVHVPEVLVPFLFHIKKYLNESVFLTGFLVVLSALSFFVDCFLGSTPDEVVDDSEDDVEDKGGGELGEDNSLIVMDVFHGAEGVGDGHVLIYLI